MAVTREFHVRRIKSEDDPDVWVDVERVDRMIVEDGSGPAFQRTFIKLFWADEEADDEHPTRTIETKRLENPDDDTQFIEIAVAKVMMFGVSAATHYKKFVNDKDENTRREITLRRVYHYDTESDPNDDGGTNYEKVEDSLDEGQYIDTAVITTYVAEHGTGPGYIRRFVKLNTESVLEHSAPSPPDADLENLVYLDPFQNIVNVQWGGHPFLALSTTGQIARSGDGLHWTDTGRAGAALNFGAYGNDRYLLASDGEIGIGGRAFVMSSDNGRTFHDVGPFVQRVIAGIAFGNGVFVVVSSNAHVPAEYVDVSEDGETWEDVTANVPFGEFDFMRGCAFAAGKFVIFGAERRFEEARMLLGFNAELAIPIYGPVSGTEYRTGRATTSEDGRTWTAATDPLEGIPPRNTPTKTYEDNEGNFHEVPTTLPPGIEFKFVWIDYAVVNGDEMPDIILAQYVNPSWESEPGSGIIVHGPGAVSYSSDGASWTITGPDLEFSFDGFYGDGVYVFGAHHSAGGPDNWVYDSERVGETESANSLGAYGRGRFVVPRGPVGTSLFASTDGMTWEEIAHELPYTEFNAVVY